MEIRVPSPRNHVCLVDPHTLKPGMQEVLTRNPLNEWMTPDTTGRKVFCELW